MPKKPVTPPTDSTAPITQDAAARFLAHFGAERWARLQRQALSSCGLTAEELQALCIKTLMTSAARHPDNAAAALCSAGNRLLLHLGSTLNADDVTRFEAALRDATTRDDAAPANGDESSPLS